MYFPNYTDISLEHACLPFPRDYRITRVAPPRKNRMEIRSAKSSRKPLFQTHTLLMPVNFAVVQEGSLPFNESQSEGGRLLFGKRNGRMSVG